MAQSQMNLTVGIQIDQGKLDADIRIAKAKMDKLSRDANALARQAVKTGAPSDAAEAERASRAATQQAEAYAGLTRQKKAHLATTVENTAAVRKEASAFRELSKYIIEFGKEAGISNLSVRGLKLGLAGLVIAEAVKQLADGVKAMHELQQVAREANLAPAAMQGLRNQFIAVGLSAKDADASAIGFYKTLRESRLAMSAARDVFTETQNKQGEAFIDPTGRIAHRITSHAEAFDAMQKSMEGVEKRDPFAAIGLSSENYAQTEAGTKKALEDTTKRLTEMQKGGQLDAASSAAEKLNINLAAAQKAVDDIAKSGVGSAIVPSAADLENLDAAIAKYATIQEITRQIRQNVGAATVRTAAGADQPMPSGGGILPSVEAGGAGLASGGYIRGPGSGTSDSILARLSNGEYVVNATSVRRLGVGYLDGLNATRFAEGGLVSAASSSGRPVHLHLGGSSFALSGSSGVVDALVSHAHGQQMRSAGVKPSWFAGRPSGR